MCTTKNKANGVQCAHPPVVACGDQAHLLDDLVVEGTVTRCSPEACPLELEDRRALWEVVRMRPLEALKGGFHAHLITGRAYHWQRSPCRTLAAPHCAETVGTEQCAKELAEACVVGHEPLSEQQSLEHDVLRCKLGLCGDDDSPSLVAVRRTR